MSARTGARPFATALPLAVLLVALTEALRVPAAAYGAEPGLLPLVLGRCVAGVCVAGMGALSFGALAAVSRLGRLSEARQWILVGLGGVATGGSLVLTVATNPKLARLVPLHLLFAALVVVAAVGVRWVVVPAAERTKLRQRLHLLLVVLAAVGTAGLSWINPRIHQHYPAFHVALVQCALLLTFVGLAGLFTLRDGLLPRRLSGAGLTAVALALAGLALVPGARADAIYLGHTMPGLWTRVTAPGASVVTEDPAPDPAWTSTDGAVERFARGARLPALPEGFDLSRYSVLVITGEAVRFDATTMGGQPRTVTPNLAALAAESLTFSRAYAGSSGTLHSMSALHGMALPSTLHVETWRRSWNGELHADDPRAATAFAEAGYQTFWIGHNHKLAFDEVILGFKEGFEDIDLVPSERSSVDTDVAVADRVVARLEKQGRRKFFGWVFLESPHSMYVSHYEDMPGATRRDVYQQEVRFLDEQLGRILDTLRGKSLLAHTVVIFAGDHGEEFGEHGGTFHKRTVYEESTNVPLVVFVPGMDPAVIDAPVSVPQVLPWLMLHGPEPVRARATERIESIFAPMMRATDDAVVVELLGHEKMLTGLIWPERKAIYDFYSGLVEVYERASDPGDRVDLGVEPEVREEVEPLLSRYRALRSGLARYAFKPQYEPG